MKVSKVQCNGYVCVYHEIPCENPTDNLISMKWLYRYELNDEYILWRIGATYTKSLDPTYYYVVAKDKKEARKKFERKLSWLGYIKSIVPLCGDSAEEILTKPAKYPMW